MASSISAGTTSATALVHTADTTGALQLATNNGTVAVTIDTSQNVGIGTTSPNFKVSFGANIGKTFALFENAGTSVYGIGMGGAGTAGDPYRTKLFSNGTENASITDAGVFSFNSGYGSSATAYGCRAWVNFNGTGTVAIRASGNVSSITDNGNGDYTMNFTSAMPDANYSAVGTAGQKAVAWGLVLFANTGAFATSGLRFITQAPNDAAGDTAFICVAIFR